MGRISGRARLFPLYAACKRKNRALLLTARVEGDELRPSRSASRWKLRRVPSAVAAGRERRFLDRQDPPARQEHQDERHQVGVDEIVEGGRPAEAVPQIEVFHDEGDEEAGEEGPEGGEPAAQ